MAILSVGRILVVAGWTLLFRARLANSFVVVQHNQERTATSLYSKRKQSGFLSFSSSFPDNRKRAPKNDMSMFLSQEEETILSSSLGKLEFFMTQDESIQKLEAAEAFFRSEPQGIMMEESEKEVPMIPFAYGKSSTDFCVGPKRIKAKMAKTSEIGADEEPPSKRFILYKPKRSPRLDHSRPNNNGTNWYSE